MIRQDVVINNYKYIVDIYKAETADLTETDSRLCNPNRG